MVDELTELQDADGRGAGHAGIGPEMESRAKRKVWVLGGDVGLRGGVVSSTFTLPLR